MVNNGKLVMYPADIDWDKVVRVGENRLAVWNFMRLAIVGASIIELREWMDDAGRSIVHNLPVLCAPCIIMRPLYIMYILVLMMRSNCGRKVGQ